MIISGLIINSSPGKLNQVQKEITIYDGVEVSSIIDKERILIAVHSRSEEEKYLISKKIENIEGVLGINFVYEYFKNLCHKYWEYPQKIVPTVVISRR